MATIRKLLNGKYRADIRKNYTFIQAKTFLSKKQAEQWSADIETNIEAILALTPSKLKALTPEIVSEIGGLDLFLKLGIELEFLTFEDLANEYMKQWSKKDANQIPRTAYWLEVFGKRPIKAISTTDTPDPKILALKTSTPSDYAGKKKPKPPRHRQGEKFLKGPIPWSWLCRAPEVEKNSVENDIFWKMGTFKTNHRIFQLLELANYCSN
jgi:hypothetical protein